MPVSGCPAHCRRRYLAESGQVIRVGQTYSVEDQDNQDNRDNQDNQDNRDNRRVGVVGWGESVNDLTLDSNKMVVPVVSVVPVETTGATTAPRGSQVQALMDGGLTMERALDLLYGAGAA
jgi:hypothetical protein